MGQRSRLPFNALRVFEAVAAALSFSAAATQLSVTPAAVSTQIKALERYLGQPLLRRRGRKVELTEEGATLYEAVRRGLDHIYGAVRVLNDRHLGGSLTLTLLPSLMHKWLVQRLPEFHRQHPDIQLNIQCDRRLIDFQRNDVHAGIRYGLGQWPSLTSEKLFDEWLIPVAAPALIARLGKPRLLAELERWPLLHSASEPWRVWFDAAGHEMEQLPAGPSYDDSAFLLMAAELGQGAALARWSLVAGDLAAGRLVALGPNAARERFSYYFVSPPAYWDTPKVTALGRFLRRAAQDFPPPP
ncbi:MAG TPA: LysR substrate-binding domain-containing protein [Steroidobacteraceae bacterium]|nr:LysR substrate-binding domain-containing protein [Steroidobacteraceae bacterium]